MEFIQDVFWNNIPYTKGKIIRNLGFLKSTVARSFLKDIKNPYIIWTGTGRIASLENKIFHSKIQNKFSKLEVFFFLYEPLCARIGPYNRSFYSEFDSTENLNNMVCDEIESIKIFVKNNNITNFRIFTSDYNVQRIQNNYPGIKINCLNIFLRTLSFPNDMEENNVTNKFWCGNWRYTTHRHLVMSYLSSLEGTYTWNLKCSYAELENNIWFNLDKLKNENLTRYTRIKTGVDYLYKNALLIDQPVDATEVINSENVFTPGNIRTTLTSDFLKSYKNSFCAVINETRFAQPFGDFSEKTLNALHLKLPIILVAPPHTLEYLKTFGFKTFDGWWDESYDAEEDHYRRMMKIFNIIDYINSKSIQELQKIYTEMKEVLDHNKQIVKTIVLNNTIL